MPPAKKTAASTAKVSALTRARAALTSVLKEDHVVPLSDDLLKQSTPHIPTGSIIVDYAIGGKINRYGIAPCPGIPRGRITQLYGQNSAGKTTLALTITASVCNSGGTVAYIDWEHEVEPRYAAALGVPLADESRFILLQPNTLEEGMKAMILFIREGVDLIVLDSVGAGLPEALWNREVEDVGGQTRPGLVAQKWSEFLPQVKSEMASSGTTVLAISQLRKTISAMSGGPDSAPQGGEAWKFYTSVRIMLRAFQKEKAKQFDPLTGKMEDKVVGTIVVLKLDKCKVSDSKDNEFKFYLRSGYGIDNTRSVVELAIAYKIITKSGAWYSWPTGPKGEVRTQGMDALLKAINEDPKNLQSLFAQVTPKLMQSVPSTPVQEDAGDEGAIDADELLAMVPSGVKKAAAAADDEG
jgi:recombination protein RecA